MQRGLSHSASAGNQELPIVSEHVVGLATCTLGFSHWGEGTWPAGTAGWLSCGTYGSRILVAWASLNPAASLVGLYRDFMQWDWQALLVKRS